MMQPTQQVHPWDQFKALKEEAYLYIDQGLRLEQTSKPDRVSRFWHPIMVPITLHAVSLIRNPLIRNSPEDSWKNRKWNPEPFEPKVQNKK